MIETNLFGGIGNQLFQFLAGIKFSKKRKQKPFIHLNTKQLFLKYISLISMMFSN